MGEPVGDAGQTSEKRIILPLALVISLLVGTAPDGFCDPPGRQATTGSGDAAVVLARVGNREITLRDFLERAEYTIRAPYCKGSSNVEKNIVLNTLIAEKLLAIEADSNNTLERSRGFQDFLAGRREQMMRELLYHSEGEEKVRLDSNEIQIAVSVAGRTYRIQCLPAGADQKDSIPELSVSWSSHVTKSIHRALFARPLRKGEVVGPFKLGDTLEVLMKVVGWHDLVAVTQTDILQRYHDVVEELTTAKADSIYDRYILRVMGGKTVRFDPEALNKLARILAPKYSNRKAKAEDEFLHSTYGRNDKNPALSGSEYFAIKDLPLLSIDRTPWTVQDLMRELDRHPLIFRKAHLKEKFVNQLRLAIVDLIRDKYLTDAAYRKGLDHHALVAHYQQTWHDASVAMFARDGLLHEAQADSGNSVRIIEESLNPYVQRLLRKHSGEILINVDAYDKVKLTRIDMFVTQADVPFTIYVPAFPVLTTYSRLDYGRRMN